MDTANLALYLTDYCSFCIRVRMAMQSMNLDIELRNIQKNLQHSRDLMDGGGKTMVPCLRISDGAGNETWLYESMDIITWLKDNVS